MTPGRRAEIACILEATARKPGNVHRFADFDDATYLDFILSATAMVEPLDQACVTGVGPAVLRAMEATRQLVGTNTNLGLILLLAPLAAAEDQRGSTGQDRSLADLRSRLNRVLDDLTCDDARLVYEAVRLAHAAGLGEVEAQDVSGTPTVTLRQAMELAADRDLIARQYQTGYTEVFEIALPLLRRHLGATGSVETAILGCFLGLLAEFPDSLILRKRGRGVANEVRRRAALVLGTNEVDPDAPAVRELDAWLRADGRGRNPGTTADLTAAALYLALYADLISFPLGQGNPRHDS